MTDSIHSVILPIERLTADELVGRADIPADAEEAFTFSARATNNSLDAYFTHMLPSSLRNYATDAGGDGVQFLEGHNIYSLGYGRTFAGRFEEVAGESPTWLLDGRRAGAEFAISPPSMLQRVVIDSFTVPGIRFAGGVTYQSTDDFIRAVEAGIVRSVSIAWSGGAYTCDICGGDYLDYRACRHFAGMVYEVGEQGERRVIATAGIGDAHLRELSAVYKGATPGALLTKAERLVEAGELRGEKIELVERRYHIELPRRIFSPGVDISAAETAENGGADLTVNKAFMEILEEAGLSVPNLEKGNDADLVRWLVAEVGTLTDQSAELAESAESLERLAADGRAYRADLIEKALADGVRALGEEFDADHYRQLFETTPLDTIRRMSADWGKVGDRRFPGGYHVIVEDGEQVTNATPVVPAGFYQS